MRTISLLSKAAPLAAVVMVLAGAKGREPAPRAATMRTSASSAAADTVVLAGGCFWGVQAVFERVKGITSALSGYAGGTAVSPSYEEVSSGATGHAESVRVVFDPAQISFNKVLEIFFSVAHDPTQLNRQGPDVGTQYRSAIFVLNADQKREAQAYIDQLTAEKAYKRPIVTQVQALRAFYPAEGYHQDYFTKHPNAPYIVYNDAPKVEHLRLKYPALYRAPITVAGQ